MKTRTIRLMLMLLFVGSATVVMGQKQKTGTLQVTDGTATATMNTDAMLQMDSNNKGMLLPRVALTGTTATAPLTAHTAGMMIYNTATTADVTPGYYYNNGTKWIKVADASAITSAGNLYTTNGTLAADRTVTMDGKKLIFNGGNVGIGTAAANGLLTLNGSGQQLLRLENDVDGEESTMRFRTHGNFHADISAHPSGFLGIKVPHNNTAGSGYDMIVNSAGNVGIGTTTPSEKLQVNGDVFVGGQDIVVAKEAGNPNNWDAISYTDAPALATKGVFSFHADGATRPGWETTGALVAAQAFTTSAGSYYFGNTDQRLAGDRIGKFYLDGNHSTTVEVELRDKEDKRYGAVYGSTDGEYFGLLDGDHTWSYRAQKDVATSFIINGSEKMRILANGNVGIGTTSPTAKLDVVGSARIRTMGNGATTDQIVTTDANGNLRKVTRASLASNANNIYNTNGTLTANRTVSMNGKSLDFNGGTVSTDKDMNVNGIRVGIGNGNSLSTASVRSTAIGYNTLNSNTTGVFNTAVGNDVLSKNTTGNYNSGLGTDAMSENTTGGHNNAFGSYALSYNTTGSGNSAFGASALQWNTTGFGNTAIGFGTLFKNSSGNENTAVGVNALYEVKGSNNIGIGKEASVPNSTGSNQLSIGNVIYGIDMDAGAKIGIGTSAPTQKLDVAGRVKATGFMVGTTNLTVPDYVFEKYYQGFSELNNNYVFKSLPEVEAFIKKNGHLPGYVSAKEVAKSKSFDMTTTQLMNIEKIEELYLHTIEQNKKIKQQQKEIDELKIMVKKLLESKK